MLKSLVSEKSWKTPVLIYTVYDCGFKTLSLQILIEAFLINSKYLIISRSIRIWDSIQNGTRAK